MNETNVGKGRFEIGSRVRIKFGFHRGEYGMVEYVGGDDGTYYGVLIDGLMTPIGYADRELDPEKPIDGVSQ